MNAWSSHSRQFGLIALGSAALLALTACGTVVNTASTTGMMNSGNGSTNSGNGMMTTDMMIDASGMGAHVHNLAFDGSRLLIGTHDGLWGQTGENKPVQISTDGFDVMGFAMAGSTWMASGHPGAGMNAPGDLGLTVSTDSGKTWKTVALSGKVDFHRLVASGKVVMGMSSSDGHLLRSIDGGRVWTDMGTPPLYDLALAPSSTDVVIGTTEQGLMRSTDGGSAFGKVKDAPLLALLATTRTAIVGIDVYGKVFTSTDDGMTWMQIGAVPSQPSALAASGKKIAALVGGTVYLSTDNGKTFTKHLAGIEGH